MIWRYWPEALLAALIVLLDSSWVPTVGATELIAGRGWTRQRKLEFRERTRELWYHGFNHYMTHAFPLDELTPLSCSGRGPDWNNPENFVFNDVAGNFSVTLLDVLDTLVVLDDRPGFENAVRAAIHWVQFDVNTKPQVFETTIRVLGGLLSAHMFANNSGSHFYLSWYRGELLSLAHDLGKRLLPAFSTPTGIPYARVNLRKGVVNGETNETCTAGAGSLLLEFATLSRLTGDERFEKAAYNAFFALWNRRTDIGLVGNTIDVTTGLWSNPEVTGIGAGIDSFYEYALKWYILSGEIEFLHVWQEAYASIMKYARATDGFWYRSVNIHTGEAAYFTVDSLSAFWPGLQVLAGDLQSAVQSHLMYWGLWRRHSGIPEVWDAHFKKATSLQYPLRPEFVESTWYLYRATRDPFYLDVGARILHDIAIRARVPCGLTGIRDLRSNERDDRMESFVLSETLKYLFLLFDEDNALHTDDSNYVFTTEGHILCLGKEHLKTPSSTCRDIPFNMQLCPAYQPRVAGNDTRLLQGIRSHADIDYSRELVALLPERTEQDLWSPNGWCEKPKADVVWFEFVMSPDGSVIPEDTNPAADILALVPDGYVLHNMTGIRTKIVKRLDGTGYDITKVGPHMVKRGQVVYINDSAYFLKQRRETPATTPSERDPTVAIRFFVDVTDAMCQVSPGLLQSPTEMTVLGYTALFGADLSAVPQGQTYVPFGNHDGTSIVQDQRNLDGCMPYDHVHDGAAILVYRGGCTFLEKLIAARDAGASGVIVISDEDFGLHPSAGTEELLAGGDLQNVAILVLTHPDGKVVVDMLNSAAMSGSSSQLRITLQSRMSEEDIGGEATSRLLHINGHPLLNTKLIL